jgi:hypothetical protein
VYYRTFLDFVCGNSTSIKTSGQNEENETGQVVQEEEVQVVEPQILKGGGQEDKEPHMI